MAQSTDRALLLPRRCHQSVLKRLETEIWKVRVFYAHAQFYAPAIFLMDRLDTKGVGQEGCGQPASKLAGNVRITHDSPLPWERWPAHDFLYFYCKRCCSLNIFNVGATMTKTEEKYVTLHFKNRSHGREKRRLRPAKQNNKTMEIIAFTVFITSLRKFYNTLIINISILQCGYPAPNRLENSHTQALAPNGALSLSLRDSTRLCQKSDFGPAYHKLGSYQVSNW